MAFMLNLLAVYPEYQTKIQEDLDKLLIQRPHEEWSVEHEYQDLQKGWLGVVLKEALRLYCVVPFLPRKIVAPLTVTDSLGVAHALPVDTLCLLDFSAAFRNPRTWARRDIPAARRAELHDSPALDFDPSRWLEGGSAAAAVDKDTKDLTPQPFFPFGQGRRICPGRIFTQIEMTAMLSTMLLNHTIELVVDERTRQACEGDEVLMREKTRDQAIRTMVDGVQSVVSVFMADDLPVQLIPRVRK